MIRIAGGENIFADQHAGVFVTTHAEVVRRNPIHFGALSGFGLNYLQKDDLPRAAEYFERALRVNPNLSQVEAILGQLRELLLRGARPSI